MDKFKQPYVFISYRRQDSSASAHWLAESLQLAYGASSVFIDTDTIRLGQNWTTCIEQALCSATVLMVLIGPNWLHLTDDHGRRRIDNPNDWVRNEIAFALDSDIQIIPILLSGVKLPVKEALPEDIAEILNFQAFELREGSWSRDKLVLFDALNEYFGSFHNDVESTPLIRTREGAQKKNRLVTAHQLKTLKAAATLVYRMRNLVRSLLDPSISRLEFCKGLDELRFHHNKFLDLLYEDRALLPEEIFRVLHRLKGDFGSALGSSERDSVEEIVDNTIYNEYVQILGLIAPNFENRYPEIIKLIQDFLRVNDAV